MGRYDERHIEDSSRRLEEEMIVYEYAHDGFVVVRGVLDTGQQLLVQLSGMSITKCNRSFAEMLGYASEEDLATVSIRGRGPDGNCG